jgi:hypothetical protein
MYDIQQHILSTGARLERSEEWTFGDAIEGKPGCHVGPVHEKPGPKRAAFQRGSTLQVT